MKYKKRYIVGLGLPGYLPQSTIRCRTVEQVKYLLSDWRKETDSRFTVHTPLRNITAYELRYGGVIYGEFEDGYRLSAWEIEVYE